MDLAQNWDMWRRLFEDSNNKQEEEIEGLRLEYNERSERLGLATAVERPLPAGSVPPAQSPMELLTPRELSLKT